MTEIGKLMHSYIKDVGQPGIKVAPVTEYERKQCEKCQYRVWLSGEPCCNYFLVTHKQRESPSGQPCNKFVEGKQLREVPYRNYPEPVDKSGEKATKPVRRKKRRKYCELTEAEKEARRAAVRRWKLKKKLEQQ